MIALRIVVVIHDLKRQGLSISAIARKTGLDRKTVRKYLERGLEAPSYSPRAPRARLIEPFEAYLCRRIDKCPGLSARRLLRDTRMLGYSGGHTAVTDFLRQLRNDRPKRFEVRSKPRRASRPCSTLPSLRSASPTSPGSAAGYRCFAMCSATAAGCGGGSVRTRSRRRCCAATSWPSRPQAAPRRKCSTTG